MRFYQLLHAFVTEDNFIFSPNCRIVSLKIVYDNSQRTYKKLRIKNKQKQQIQLWEQTNLVWKQMWKKVKQNKQQTVDGITERKKISK